MSENIRTGIQSDAQSEGLGAIPKMIMARAWWA